MSWLFRGGSECLWAFAFGQKEEERGLCQGVMERQQIWALSCWCWLALEQWFVRKDKGLYACEAETGHKPWGTCPWRHSSSQNESSSQDLLTSLLPADNPLRSIVILGVCYYSLQCTGAWRFPQRDQRQLEQRNMDEPSNISPQTLRRTRDVFKGIWGPLGGCWKKCLNLGINVTVISFALIEWWGQGHSSYM